MKSTDQAPAASAPDIFALVDEPAIANFIGEIILRHRVYAVRLFRPEDVPRLIEEFRLARSRPRLLIAKSMNGVGVVAAQACREIEPGLKLMVISGFLSGWISKAVTEGPTVADAVIALPFRPPELIRQMERLLGAPRPAVVESTAQPTNTSAPAPSVPHLPRPASQCPLILFHRIFPFGRCVTGVPTEYLRALARSCGEVAVYCGSLITDDWSSVLKTLAAARKRGHPVVLITSEQVITVKLDGLPAIVAYRSVHPALRVVVETGYPQNLVPEALAHSPGAVDAIVGTPPTQVTLQEWNEIKRQRTLAISAFFRGGEREIPEDPSPEQPVTHSQPDLLRAALKRLMVELGCRDFDLTR